MFRRDSNRKENEVSQFHSALGVKVLLTLVLIAIIGCMCIAGAAYAGTVEVYDFWQRNSNGQYIASCSKTDKNFDAQFKLKNNSSYTIQHVALAAHDSSGKFLFDLRKDSDVNISSGNTYHFNIAYAYFLNSDVGNFQIIAKAFYNNEWHNLSTLSITILKNDNCNSNSLTVDHFTFEFTSYSTSTTNPMYRGINANVDFEVTITARDANGNVVTGFNEPISLSDLTGTLTSLALKKSFISGIWKHNVLILIPYKNNQLIAAYKGVVKSYSSTFDILGISMSCTVAPSGTVVDRSKKALNKANVRLVSGMTIVYEATTKSDGTFSMPKQSCGNYNIYAEWNGYKSPTKSILLSWLWSNKLEVDTVDPKGKTPVLFVPGFFGSTIKDSYSSWDAILDRDAPTARGKLKLNDPFEHSALAHTPGSNGCNDRNGVGWCHIRKLLEANGFWVVDAPYDWRMSIDTNKSKNSVDEYLKPA